MLIYPTYNVVGFIVLVCAIIGVLYVAIKSIVKTQNAMCCFFGHKWSHKQWLRNSEYTHVCERCGETGIIE
jgi:uncharacterized membrane protein YbaN (DUF454 family)